MTVEEWAEANTGVVLKIPAGTVIHRVWWYLEEGEWTPNPKHWQEGLSKEYRAVRTTQDQFVDLHVDAAHLQSQAVKACRNRTRRSVDGPLTLMGRKV